MQCDLPIEHYQALVDTLQEMAVAIVDESAQVLVSNVTFQGQCLPHPNMHEEINLTQCPFFQGQNWPALLARLNAPTEGSPTGNSNAVLLEWVLSESDCLKQWRMRGRKMPSPSGNASLYLLTFHHTEHAPKWGLFESTTPQVSVETLLNELDHLKRALSVSTIVAITNTQGKIIYANDAFCRISKYEREELMGQDHRIINSGHHVKGFFQMMWDTIGEGRVWTGEVRNRAKDGSHYWVHTTIVPFCDSQGRPYQYVAIRHDITARKRVESELKRLNEDLELRVKERTQALELNNQELANALAKLQESESLRSTFISALTHDLRTPLVAQKRALEILDGFREQLPERLAGLAERLLASNDDLLAMVNKLLETYEYEAGQIQLERAQSSLSQLVHSCFITLTPLADKKQITLENNLPKNLLHIDPEQMQRVLHNLVGNAIENIPANSIIRIEPAPTQPHQGFTFWVCDNGPGIPAEVRHCLFERYFAGHKRRKKIGTGLGLYISKMIITLHGGTIRILDETELTPPHLQGTCFEIFLPFPEKGLSAS